MDYRAEFLQKLAEMEGEEGEKNFVPFRFQRQYEDEEPGLYYNRFRYY